MTLVFTERKPIADFSELRHSARTFPGLAHLKPKVIGHDGRTHWYQSVESARLPHDPRGICIRLPAGWNPRLGSRCPIVVLHDGQCALDNGPDYLAHKPKIGFDTICDKLTRDRIIPPVVLVAMFHSNNREGEYAPASVSGKWSRLQEHSELILNELLPDIRDRYLTSTAPEETVIVGTSYGAHSAARVAAASGGRIGRVGCMSPSLAATKDSLVEGFSIGKPYSGRIYLDTGSCEASKAHFGEVENALKNLGMVGPDRLFCFELTRETHDEESWRFRAELMLAYLLAESGASFLCSDYVRNFFERVRNRPDRGRPYRDPNNV